MTLPTEMEKIRDLQTAELPYTWRFLGEEESSFGEEFVVQVSGGTTLQDNAVV